MSPTRRTILATFGTVASSGVASTAGALSNREDDGPDLAPRPRSTGVPRGEATGGPGAGSEQSTALEPRVAWTLSENDAHGYQCLAAAPSPDGGLVAACNLLDTANEVGPATRLIAVTPDGSTEPFATIGDPGTATEELVTCLVPGLEGGYLAAGIRIPAEDGRAVDFEARLVRVDADGSIAWDRRLPVVDEESAFPHPVSIVRTADGYVIAVGNWLGLAGTGFAAVDPAGEAHWTLDYDPEHEHGVSPQAIVARDDDLLFLGTRVGGDQGSSPPSPVLASLSHDGRVQSRAAPAVDGSRVPLDVAATADRITVVGSESGTADAFGERAWAMALDDVGATPTWSRTASTPGGGFAAVAAPDAWDGPVAGGRTAEGRRIATGLGPPSSEWDRTFDGPGYFATFVEQGDGSVYAVGHARSGRNSTLRVVRLVRPLGSAAFDVSASPSAPEPGESVSLTLETGPFDPALLDVTWRAEGTSIGTGRRTSTAFDATGDRPVVVEVRTADGRSVELDRTVTVEADSADGDDADGLPGFGVGVATVALAGATARYLRRPHPDEE